MQSSWHGVALKVVAAFLLLGGCSFAAISVDWRLSESRPSEPKLTGLFQTIQKFEVDPNGWHRAVLNTLIRENESLGSPVVQTLPMGRFVHVVTRHGRRVRIDYPAHGWTSIESEAGDPILMWDAPEATNKNIWSLPQKERSAVLEAREVLRLNVLREKEAKHDSRMRKGITSLVRRYQSGELQKSVEDALSVEGIKRAERKIEGGIQNAENVTQKVLETLSQSSTNLTANAVDKQIRKDAAIFQKQKQQWSNVAPRS
mmetsp:Transcript_31519/g.59180  ORF Transcript_31519/g.59180 Transcript_31519/m.59180 type:complete len:258 (-) Transcript_31519:117-890(-)